MRILQVAIQAQGGGAEKVALILHQQFILQNDAWISYLYSKMRLEIANAKYLNIKSFSAISLFIGVFRLFKLARCLRPEVTVIHCEPAMLLSALTPGLGKLFLVEHQPFYWKGLKGLVIRVAMHILALRGSKTIHLRMSRTSDQSPIYIPNPIELFPSQPFSLPKIEQLQITWVGRLSYDKGFDRIPKVLELSKEKHIDIYGEGTLKTRVKFDNIDANFHGFDPQVWDRLSENSLLLVTSRWEGDGLVILEALMRQIPLLVIHFDDIDELPIPKPCISTDEEDMASKIRDLRLGRMMLSELVNTKAFAEITSSRNPVEISNRYLKVFKEAQND